MQDYRAVRDWLTLALAPGLGNQRLHQLKQAYDTGSDALAGALSGEVNLPAASRQWLRSPDRQRIDQHLQWAEHPQHHILLLGGDRYPELLAGIAGAPMLLYVVGNPDCLWQPQIALVGSRAPSHNGRLLAAEMATQLAGAGLIVTSGLAEGIDAVAHQSALDAGQPSVAVLGTGVDRVYPAANKLLAQRIAAQGALVSEFALGTEPRAGHFPARNRIISGLCLATLVIEAGLRSGSLITARLAGEQGREILAVPGSVRNPTSRGCHALIRDGARLVENASQVLQEIAPLAGQLAQQINAAANLNRPAETAQSIEPTAADHHNETLQQGLDEDYQQLLQALGGDPLSLDELVEATDLTPGAISSMLLMLELRGQVAAEPGGNWTRIHEVG